MALGIRVQLFKFQVLMRRTCKASTMRKTMEAQMDGVLLVEDVVVLLMPFLLNVGGRCLCSCFIGQ